MQILASALPGFRDLRAPLTAGYLWLIFIWIVRKPDLATRPTNDIAGSLWDLGKAAGPIWIALSVSVAAYLIGSVNQFAAILLKNGFHLIANRSDTPYQFSYSNIYEQLRLVESTHPIDALTREAQMKLFPFGLDSESDSAQIKFIEDTITERAVRARQGMWKELTLPATLLIGKDPELFTEADRLKAESDLRLAVAPPLFGIFLLLSIIDVAWWAIALIPVAVIAVQGYYKDREFQSLMEAAVIHGTIRSHSITALEMWVLNLPPDGKPPTAERKPN